MARADDPMAIVYNPAALAFLPGYQLQLGSHLVLYDACVQRSGTYNSSDVLNSGSGFDSRFGYADPAADNWVNQPFPRVCRGGPPGPSPQLVFSAHPIPELGLALGFNAPAGVGTSTWGDDDGTVTRADGVVLPTPNRYGGVNAELLLFDISLGAGYSPIKELAFGLTLQWGMSFVNFQTFTSAGSGPEDPAQDVRTQVQANDLFIPAVIGSVHVVPIPQLDITAMARFTDGISADGSLNLTTGYYGTGMAGGYTPFSTTINDVNLTSGQPWVFGLAVRYSDQRNPNGRHRDPDQAGRVSGRIEDPMVTENFDLELDVVYQLNAQVQDFVVTQPPGAAVDICEGPRTAEDCAMNGPSLTAPLPPQLPLAHGWRDQILVRAGADWNVIPGMLALRTGAHFESSGVNSTYQIHDFIPGMRLGLHLGMTFRIERFDVSIAYAHIFQFDETITDANAGFRHVAATGMEGVCPGAGGDTYDRNQPVVSRGCYPNGVGSVVNAGTYQAEFNVVSLSARYNFN
ncbi:MAG: OmpP1/FadL family transporter [Sandaracinaceae bacterium]